MLLAINTSTKECNLAILNNNRLIHEIAWISNADESERIFPNIQKLLNSCNCSFKQINKVLVINGPGSFTRLRIGVTIANALAFSLKIPIYSLNVFELLKLKFRKVNIRQLLINAGGENVFTCPNEKKINIYKVDLIKIQEFKTKNEFAGELSENQLQTLLENKLIPQNEMISFGKALEKINIDHLDQQKIVQPFYIRDPQITKSKKK
jgi:tRNA threonylcarbamoyl adenosine modification protein YeaZ